MKLCFYTESEIIVRIAQLENAKTMPALRTGEEDALINRCRAELKYRKNRANRMPPNW